MLFPPLESPAKYILETIGAGATASANQDWNDLWKCSPESAEVQREVTKGPAPR